MKTLPAELDGQPIRHVYDEGTETWWFSVIDVVPVLTQQSDDLTVRKYWNQLKRRLGNDGSQRVTACHPLKMPAADSKQRLTDVATAETLLRLVQSIPSPKAEPIKLGIALECNREAWMLRMRRMGSCPCKQQRIPIARFHSNPSGKALVRPQKDLEQVLTTRPLQPSGAVSRVRPATSWRARPASPW